MLGFGCVDCSFGVYFKNTCPCSPGCSLLHRNPSCEVHQEPVSLNVIDPSLHDTLPQCINTRCSQRYTSRYNSLYTFHCKRNIGHVSPNDLKKLLWALFLATASAFWTVSGAWWTVMVKPTWTSRTVRCRKSVSEASLVLRVPMRTASGSLVSCQNRKSDIFLIL